MEVTLTGPNAIPLFQGPQYVMTPTSYLLEVEYGYLNQTIKKFCQAKQPYILSPLSIHKCMFYIFYFL